MGLVDKAKAQYLTQSQEPSEPLLTSFKPDPEEGLPSELKGNQNEPALHELAAQLPVFSCFRHLRL